MTGPLAAIVLAGGRASRLGGAAKPLLEVGGRTLIDGVLAALADAGVDPIVVCGPPMPVAREVSWVREDPPFGGPVTGIAAGLRAVDAERVALLAADLARPAAALAVLLPHAVELTEADAVCLADPDGRSQWLAGVYRADALRRGLAALADSGRDASLRDLLRGMRIRTVPASREAVADVDTWQDLEQARANEETM